MTDTYTDGHMTVNMAKGVAENKRFAAVASKAKKVSSAVTPPKPPAEIVSEKVPDPVAYTSGAAYTLQY